MAPPGAVGGHVRIAAPAKINLFLHVVARRADGYHTLDTLFAFVDIEDAVDVRSADAISLEIDGPFAGGLGAGEDNLVMRAARALAAETPGAPGATIRLVKNLPLASGIGGGSADAAATLKALRALWRAPVDDARLAAIGLALGADVPVCLRGEASRAGGVGERLRGGVRLPDCGVLLVNPGVAVSTAEVFRLCRPAADVAADVALPVGDVRGFAEALLALRNDLEEPALTVAPVIAEVLDALLASPGCLLARMSGSGATCFGLYTDGDEAEAAAAAIAARHPGWWVRATRFRSAAPQPVRG